MKKNNFEIVEETSNFYNVKINGKEVGRYCWLDAVEILSCIAGIKQKMEAKTGLHPEISFQANTITISTYLHKFSFGIDGLMPEDMVSVEKRLEEYLAGYNNGHRICQSVNSANETRNVFQGGNR